MKILYIREFVQKDFILNIIFTIYELLKLNRVYLVNFNKFQFYHFDIFYSIRSFHNINQVLLYYAFINI